VTVNEIKERILPELDDDWVDDNTEFETVDELTSQLRAQLEDVKRRAVSREYADKALASLRESVDLTLPEALVRAEMDNQLHTFVHRLEDAELKLDDYFEATGISRDDFVEDLRNQAELSLSNRLILEAVAEKEDLKVTEDDMSRALQVLAARSKDPVAFLQAFQRSGQELALASDILRNRALDAILTNAQPVDEDGNPVELTVDVPEVEAEVLDDEIVEGEVVATIEEEEE
jgi:trigger factor